MMEAISESDSEHSGLLMQELKGLTGAPWKRFITLAASATSSGSDIQRTLQDSLSGQRDSWSGLLRALTSPVVGQCNGNLTTYPVIFSLPPVLQNRLCHIIHRFRHEIPRQEFKEFTDKLYKHKEGRSAWIKYWIKKLHHALLSMSKPQSVVTGGENEEDCHFELCEVGNEDVKTLYEKILQRLGTDGCVDVRLEEEDGATKHDTGGSVLKNIEPKARDKSPPMKVQEALDDESEDVCDGEKTVDVIVIDSASDDDVPKSLPRVDDIARKQTDPLMNIKSLKTKEQSAPSEDKSRKRSHDETAVDARSASCSKVNKTSMEEVESSKIQVFDKAAKEVVASSDNLKESDNVGIEMCEASAGVVKDKEEIDKNKKEAEKDMCTLSNELKLILGAFKDSVTSPECEDSKMSEFWMCLGGLSLTELRQCCEFLGLSCVSEESLVHVLESMQHETSFSTQATSVLMDCVLGAKLRDLCSHASHTLESAVTAAMKHQPLAVLDIFLDVLRETHSGEPQSHLFHVSCRDGLSKTNYSCAIRGLASHALSLNDHLIQVLQTGVNLRCDLDPEGLSAFVSVLCAAGQSFSQDSKFGQLLLAFVTKYGNKACSADVNKLETLVGQHKSSFSKALSRGMKKLMH